MVSPNLKLLFAWIGYINNKDTASMKTVMSNDFVNLGRPASLGFPGPAMGPDAFIERFLSAPIANFNISLPTSDNIIETGNLIAFYTTANGRTIHGLPWIMEYSNTMTFEGGKITTFYEFVDSYTLKNTFYNESVAAAACGK